MLFNPQNPYDLERADEYYRKVREGQDPFEIKRKAHRTLSQNAYLHLILGYFASQYGCTEDEAKLDFFKRTVNLPTFCPDGGTRKDGKPKLRSTRALDKAEMSTAIDRFRNWSAIVAGIYLPSAEDHQMLIHAAQEIERNKEYL